MRFLLILLTASLLLAPIVSAQEAEGVRVGVYVLNIGKFDLVTGSYTIDFYISMECDNPCESGNFEFLNGRADYVDKLIDENSSKFYRIQASLLQNIDLKSYPFDKHSLIIELEDKTKTKEELAYIPDTRNSGVDSAVTIVGWALDGWDAEVVDHYYEPYDETFSRFIFAINIHRLEISAILKILLPVFFIVIVGLLALLIAPDKVPNRLALNTSTLLSAVLFHINATSSIPPVGYLTFADKFMIITYIALIASLVSTLILMRHTETQEHEKATRIYKRSLQTVPLLTVLLYGALFFII